MVLSAISRGLMANELTRHKNLTEVECRNNSAEMPKFKVLI